MPSTYHEPPKKIIRALRDHTASMPGHLSFEAGDFFYVVEEDLSKQLYHVSNPLANTKGLVPMEIFEVLDRREDRIRRSNNRSISSSDKRSSRGSSVLRRPSVSKIIVDTPGASPTPSTTSSTFQPRPRQMSALVNNSGIGRVRRDSHSHLCQVHGMVLYDFHGETEDELSVSKDEPIMVVAQSNEEWFLVKPMVRVAGPGLVPVSFVELRDHITGKPVPDLGELYNRYGITLPTVSEWKREMLAWGKVRCSALLNVSPTSASSSCAGPTSAKEANTLPTPNSMTSVSCNEGNRASALVASSISGAATATTSPLAASSVYQGPTADTVAFPTAPPSASAIPQASSLLATSRPLHRRTPSHSTAHISLVPPTLKQRGRAHTTSSTTSSIADRSSIRLCPKSRHGSMASINRSPNEQLPPFAPGDVAKAEVSDVICKDGAYLYKLAITFTDNSERNIYRSYEDFCQSQADLIDLVKRVNSGTEYLKDMPRLSPPQSYVNDSICARRQSELHNYVQYLIEQSEAIVCCPPVQHLFGSTAYHRATPSRSPLSSSRSDSSLNSTLSDSTINSSNSRATTPISDTKGLHSRNNSDLWADSDLTTIDTSSMSKDNSFKHDSASFASSPLEMVSQSTALLSSSGSRLSLHHHNITSTDISTPAMFETAQSPHPYHQNHNYSSNDAYSARQTESSKRPPTASGPADKLIKVKLSIDGELTAFRLSKDSTLKQLTAKVLQKIQERDSGYDLTPMIECRQADKSSIMLESDEDLQNAISVSTKLFLSVRTQHSSLSSPPPSPLPSSSNASVADIAPKSDDIPIPQTSTEIQAQ
ncbi:bud emergence protein 1 [Spiromyces aspiralis]|uniref:Bud emergence protein 1 n=1 Tax=Spiromyces aspiralis TaxID=68401 RepID=A0ACC1HXI8_9FUNG|nr:bud emergence protein 1 [Spiromyces aspiralis]